MPDVTTCYGISFDLIALLGHFYKLLLTIHAWSVVPPPNFHGLCVDMPDVITSYGRFFSLIGSLGILMFDTLYFHQFFINFVESLWK